MNTTTYFKQLGICILLSFALILGSNYLFPAMEQHMPFLWISLLVMTCIAVFTLIMAFKVAQTTNKYAFSRFSMTHTFLKLTIIVVLVVIYKQMGNLESIIFIWPYLLMYLIFTVLETHYLLKFARL